MARLNEPPMMADSLDTLRRRFLRQNRDIARVNSNQSLRIRGLENECARLLSENLELRSQVMRLEKELDDNSSRRIADHALQVKEKMEAQLLELGSLLAGFGLEPPKKKQSPTAGRRESKPLRLSLASEPSSPLEKKFPELSPKEAEALAEKEGRLPPIYESKTYPRQTMNREEILALCSDALDATDSPELGPPPVSRLFHDDSRMSAGSPSKSAPTSSESESKSTKIITAASVDHATEPETPMPAPSRTIAHENPNPETESNIPLRGKSANKTPAASPAPLKLSTAVTAAIKDANATPAPKAGAKRKFAINDENTTVAGTKTGSNEKSLPTKGNGENSLPVRELKNPRSIRDLASNRREQQAEVTGGKAPSGGRKPLSMKSTNEDVSSPRKRANDEAVVTKPGNGKPAAAGNRMKDRKKLPLVLDAPSPLSPAVAEVVLDKETTNAPVTPTVLDERPANLEKAASPSLDPEVVRTYPSTPPPISAPLTTDRSFATRLEIRDTPPPADISLQGETSRPNRRARASVSYAEPNLRDKMRRPTKELLDAVAGEGRYIQRQQLHHQDLDHEHSQPDSIAQPSSHGMVPDPASTKKEASPLTAEQSGLDEQSDSSHVAPTNRRKRASAAGSRQHEQKAAETSAAAKKGGPDSCNNKHDPYEFTLSSSPQCNDSNTTTKDEDMDAEGGDLKGTVSASGRRPASGSVGPRSSKATRRASAANVRDGTLSSGADRHTKPPAARKRTSMVAPRKGSMLENEDEEDDPGDSSYEPGGDERDAQADETRTMSTRDRISRRRSMML